jgi:hypothetical protein
MYIQKNKARIRIPISIGASSHMVSVLVFQPHGLRSFNKLFFLNMRGCLVLMRFLLKAKSGFSCSLTGKSYLGPVGRMFNAKVIRLILRHQNESDSGKPIQKCSLKPKVLFDAKKRSKRTGPKVVSVTFQY